MLADIVFVNSNSECERDVSTTQIGAVFVRDR